jgi:hypothetical protein
MEHNKKLYLFYFIFLTLGLISFSVSSIFFNNLYTELLYQITIAGTLFFVSGYLLNSIGWPYGNKKYKIFRSIASISFPFSCLDIIFKTFKVELFPQLLTGIVIILAGLVFIVTYFYSVLESVRLKNLSKPQILRETIVKKERNYLPLLLVILFVVILTSLLLVNPQNIFSPTVQLICGTVGVFLSLFAGVAFAIISAAEIYKAGTK